MKRIIGVLILVIIFGYGFNALASVFGVELLIEALLFSVILTAIIGFAIFLIAPDKNKKEELK